MSAEKNDSPLNVQGAMKILNMKKLDADELNDRFKFRVLSVSQGLGGSLKKQKSVYSAWEYLNRTLAKESSSHVEDILKKVDKTGAVVANMKKSPLKFGQQNTISSAISNKGPPNKNKIATKKNTYENTVKPSNKTKIATIKGGVSLRMVDKKGLENGLAVSSENGRNPNSKNKIPLKINSSGTKGIQSDGNVGHTNKTLDASKSSFNPSINSDKSKLTEGTELKTNPSKIPLEKSKKGLKQTKIASGESVKNTRPERTIWKQTANIFVKPELAKKAVATIKKKTKDVKKPRKEQQVLYKTSNFNFPFGATDETKRIDDAYAEETGGFYTNSRINNWILSGKYGIK